MSLVPYYEHFNRNVGRIKELDFEHNLIVVNVCAGHGGGEMKVPLANCHNFEPKEDDRVLLCVDNSGKREGFWLMKLTKNRQEKHE